MRRLYMPCLKWSIQHRKIVFITAGCMLVITLGIFKQIGSTFMPTMDEGDIVLQLEKLPSITLEDSVALDLQVQKNILKNVPEVKNIIARVGSDELGLDPMSLNDTDTFLELHPKEQWRMASKAELERVIREAMAGTPGVAFGFTQPIEMRVSEMLTGTRGDVAVKLFGTDLNLLNTKAEQIESILKTIPGASDVFTRQNKGMQYLQLTIDRMAAGRLGLNIQEIQQILRAQI